MKYIDVSQWQQNIDWEQAKSHIDGAIIRAGYGRNNIDQTFARNATECNRLGIPCGAYWFSYAATPEEAKAEAQYLLAAVKPYRMELPLCFDFEYDSVSKAQKRGVNITKSLATSLVYAFCGTIEAGGYWCLNYANPDFLSRYFSADVPQRFGLWLAQWPGGKPDVTKPPRSDCQVWQWGGSAIPGITPGDDVDTNESYVDFKTLIAKYGLNHLEEDVKPIDPVVDALKWAQSNNITDDPELALALWRYHNTFRCPEDEYSIGTKG